MPELPEVEIIVSGLRKTITGLKIKDVWSDWKKTIKNPFDKFKRELIGRKIKKVRRRGKNILIDLDKNKTLLIHQKLTGHLLYGKWKFTKGNWKSASKGPLEERVNNYIHLMFYLSSGKMLGLSDLRKFAKVILADTDELAKLADIKNLGPEPFEKGFTFRKFEKIIKKKMGKIKQVLMNQEVIAGIGNIYSDEILWAARINPFKETSVLKNEELKKIYSAMKSILKKSISVRGDSMSDFRDIFGRKGGYQNIQKVYQRERKPCKRCETKIERKKIGGRSAHFCPKCQKI